MRRLRGLLAAILAGAPIIGAATIVLGRMRAPDVPPGEPGGGSAGLPMLRAWAPHPPCVRPIALANVCIGAAGSASRPRTVFPAAGSPPAWAAPDVRAALGGLRNPSFAQFCSDLGEHNPLGLFFEFGSPPPPGSSPPPGILPALAVAQASALQNTFHAVHAAIALHRTVRSHFPEVRLPADPADLRVHLLNRADHSLRNTWFRHMSFLFSAVARDPGRNILVDEASPFNRSAGIDRYVPPDVPDAPACFAHSVWGLYPTMRHHNQYFPSDFVAYRNAMLVEHYRGLVFGEGPFPAEPFPDGRAVLHPSLRRPFRPLPGPPPSLPSGTVFEPPPGSPLSPPFRYPCHPSLIPLTLLLRNPLNPDRNLTNPHDALRWISELNPALEQRYGARVVPALASFDPPFPPDRQLLTAFRSRIFAGVHGAGLSWGLFLPPGSVLLEITVPWMMRHQLPGWEFGKPVEGFSGNGSEGMWFAQFAAAVGAAHYRTRMYAGAGGSVTLERADWEEAVDKAVEYVVRESKGTCSLDR